jgi:hypothetical protein
LRAGGRDDLGVGQRDAGIVGQARAIAEPAIERVVPGNGAKQGFEGGRRHQIIMPPSTPMIWPVT